MASVIDSLMTHEHSLITERPRNLSRHRATPN